MGRMPEATRFIPADHNGYFERISSGYCGRPLPMPIWPKPLLPASVMPRIRHSVECSKCLTRCLVSRSPYENGSYLLPTIEGCRDEYTLYCRCKAAASRWKSSEFKSCEVSTAAFERGYGTPEEIMVIGQHNMGSGNRAWVPSDPSSATCELAGRRAVPIL
jgi:hypothetical protein